MVRRAVVITPQPTVVIIAGCVLTALCVVSNHQILRISIPIWITLFVIAAVCYGLWERIETLWRQVS